MNIDEQGGIGWAVKHLLDGYTVARRGWNGRGMFLYYVGPKEPFLGFAVMVTVQGDHVPWLCSQTDLFATDWQIVNGPEVMNPIA